VRVALIEKHTLPIITARIRLDAGSVRESADKAGVAVLTANLLSEGAAGMTGGQIADTMAALGAQYSTTGSYGSAAANVTSLPTVFGDALSLAAKTVMNPSFTESDFSRLRSSAIAAYERSQSTAEGVAGKIFNWALFEPSTSYSRPSAGTKASLSAPRRRLLEAMQQLNFGQIRGFVIRDGEPVFRPETRIIRDIKLGGEGAPRRESSALDDFVLKSEVREMFDHLSRLGNGCVAAIHVQNGLPTRLTLEQSA